MAVISITITESVLNNVAGIPNTITLTTNVPATIFYTLDGTEPDNTSSVAVGPIKLPTDIGTVVFKAFATDGVTSSPVITESFGPVIVGNRNPHDKVYGLNDLTKGATFPFGSQDQGGPAKYGNIGGLTVDAPDIVGFPDGFDGSGTGTPSNETDKALDEYDFIFSETNSIGERGAGIGNLPNAQTTLVVPDPITPLSIAKGSSNTASPVFNPRSMVIFQDSREEPYDPDVPNIMRSNFNLEDVGTARYGALLHTSAFDGNIPMGSALKSHYNPRDNTQTYYYRDPNTNRWIVSKVPFSPIKPNLANFAQLVFGREQGAGRVFQWAPFRYRTLW